MLTPLRAWGAVTAAGSTAAQTFDGLASGSRFLRPGNAWGTSAPIGRALLDPPGPDRALRLVEAAAREALEHAGVELAPDAVVLVATTKGDMVRQRRLFERGDEHWPWGLPFSIADGLAARLGFCGERVCIGAACASGIVALGQAASRIASGTSMALVVAVDALDPFIVRGFEQLKALDSRGCRPFADDRAGLSVAEGAAAVLLHSGSSAPIVLSGYGASSDAHHVTAPQPEGLGLQRALRQAMGDVSLERVGAVFTHGTGTAFNDAMEDAAHRSVFGAHRPIGHAHKGQLGHTMGAAGLLNVVMGCEALTRGELPPYVHQASPELSLRFEATSQALDAQEVLACASGFAGINAVARLRLGPAAVTPTQVPRREVEACALVADAAGESAWRNSAGSRARRMDSLCLAGCSVGKQVLAASGLSPADMPSKFGVVLGSALGCLATDAAFWLSPREGPGAHPRLFAYTLANVVLGELASQEGLTSEALVISAGRVSALAALAEAVRRVCAGTWDAALVLMLEVPNNAEALAPKAVVVKAVTEGAESTVANRLAVRTSGAHHDSQPAGQGELMAGVETLWSHLTGTQAWSLAVHDGGYRVYLEGQR